jgi:Transcriptional regulators
MRKSSCHCINLRRANKAVTDFYDRKLEGCGVTVNQFSLLSNIKREGDVSVSGLADVVGLERSTLVRTLRPLLDAGLVEDRAAPGTRNRRLHLTDSGEKTLEIGRPLWKNAQREVEQKLGRDNITVLYGMLEALREL